MKKLFLLMLLFQSVLLAYAETKENRKENPHEIRIGIADNHYEIAHTPKKDIIHGIPRVNHGILSTGHIFTEYQYRINSWLSAGCLFDYMHNWEYQCGCQNYTIDENGNPIEIMQEKLFSSHISILPTIRFTYFHDKYVNIYSSIGLGAHLSYNNYDNIKTNFTNNLGAALDICALGLSVGNNHWFGTFELGNMNTFTFPTLRYGTYAKTTITTNALMSKVLRISFGYRF
jgi:hypothetical protein